MEEFELSIAVPMETCSVLSFCFLSEVTLTASLAGLWLSSSINLFFRVSFVYCCLTMKVGDIEGDVPSSVTEVGTR